MERVSRSEFMSELASRAARAKVPIDAMIELTYGCNLNCVHCYNPTHEAVNELPTGEVLRILDQVHDLGCLSVGFTGGEPFTRRDALEIFGYARSKGFEFRVLTNATLITPAKADRLKELAPFAVEVSIYGATKETYEGVTRVPGSYRRFLAGVTLLRQRGVSLYVKMPVMTLNAHEILQAREMVQGWGVRFIYSSEIMPRVDRSMEPLQYRLSPEAVVKVSEEIVGLRPAPDPREGACGAEGGPFSCRCGRTSFAVTPFGEMNLCVSFPIPRYNLVKGTVREGWNELVGVVDRANAQPSEAYECPTCELYRFCRQGPVNAWLETKSFDPCLPYFYELAGLEKKAVSG